MMIMDMGSDTILLASYLAPSYDRGKWTVPQENESYLEPISKSC